MFRETNTEGRGRMKGFSVTVLIVCWLVAVTYEELAERSPGAFRAGCWQARCVLEWASRLCTAVPHLLGMKASHGGRGAQGLLSIAAAGVHNRALLQDSAPCLCAAAHRGHGFVQSHGHWQIPVHSLAREPPARMPLPAFPAQGVPVHCLTAPTSVSLATISF